VIIIPKKNGEIKFNEQRISYFDTAKKEYETIIIPGQNINVTGGDIQVISQPNDNINQPAGSKTIEIKQVLYSQVANDDIAINLNQNILYITLVILVIGLLGLIYIFVRANITNVKNSQKYKPMLRKAKNIEAVYIVFELIMKDHYHVNIKSVTKEELGKVIDDDEQRKKVYALMDYFEHEKYYSEMSIDELKERITKII